MAAGKRDRLVTLQHVSYTRNASGEDIAIYTEYAQVWAGKRDLRGREFFSAQMVNAELQATWNILWREDVVHTDRLVDESGVVYDIAHKAEIGRHKELDLICRAPVA